MVPMCPATCGNLIIPEEEDVPEVPEEEEELKYSYVGCFKEDEEDEHNNMFYGP
jgi:hypothetical protein